MEFEFEPPEEFDIPYVPIEEEADFELKPEFAALQRTTRFVAPQFIGKGLYRFMLTEEEKVVKEIRNELLNYEERGTDKYNQIETTVTSIENLGIYNPLLLVLAGLFNYDYVEFSSTNFNSFIRDNDPPVPKEDLVRYIRLLRKASKREISAEEEFTSEEFTPSKEISV